MQVKVTRSKLYEIILNTLDSTASYRACVDVVDTIMEKNEEYGDSWQKFAIFVPLIRIREKLVRTETLAGRRQALTYDGNIDKELDDVIAYALLAKLWLAENAEEDVLSWVAEMRKSLERDGVIKGDDVMYNIQILVDCDHDEAVDLLDTFHKIANTGADPDFPKVQGAAIHEIKEDGNGTE